MACETSETSSLCRPIVIRIVLCSAFLLMADAHGQNSHRLSPDTNIQFQQLQEEAKKMGPWDREAGIITDAYTHIFEKNGWNTEPDRFSLDLVNQVSRIEPWKPAERQEIFLNAIQLRYDLTHDQRTLIDREMRMEMMKVTLKHFKDIAPIALEIARARVLQKPFTPQQVQKWASKLKPIMDDSLTAVERVQASLEKSMSAEQRRLLDTDMKAVLKRHHAIEKMVKNWRAGKWNPTDWGLDNDPIHAGAMAEYRMKQAQRNDLVELALLKNKPDEKATATDENAWEHYVKWFCNFYKCDDRQRGIAHAILKDSLNQARTYLRARRREIDKAKRLSEIADSEAKRQYHASELERLNKPVADIFHNLCNRLQKQILTTEQQRLVMDEKVRRSKKVAQKKASKHQ